jgi:hypothetical protein
MIRLEAAALIPLALALAVPAKAAPLPRYGVFVYRNFCTEAESGDAGGIGLTVIRSYEGDAALFEYSEGAIAWPLLAAPPLTIDKAGRLKARFGTYDVEADLTAEAAVVTVDHDASVAPRTRLPRVTDLGGKIPACKAR